MMMAKNRIRNILYSICALLLLSGAAYGAFAGEKLVLSSSDTTAVKWLGSKNIASFTLSEPGVTSTITFVPSSGKQYIWIEIEDEVGANVQKPGTSWDSIEEKNPSWRLGLSNETYSGTGDWYLSRGGDTLTYNVNVSETGSYVFWMRDWTDKKHPFGSQEITITIDGTTVGNFNEHTGDAGYGWQKHTSVSLSVGSHTLKITKTQTTSSAAILDAMLLTTDVSYTPSGKVPSIPAGDTTVPPTTTPTTTVTPTTVPPTTIVTPTPQIIVITQPPTPQITQPTATPKPVKFRVGPSVTLRPVTDVIEENQDGIVELFMNNPSLNDVTLNVDAQVSVPSGLHVSGENFGQAAGAGVVAGTFSVPPGKSRTISIAIKADKSARKGSHTLQFTGLYYPDDNKDAYQPISLTYSVTVKAASKEIPEPAQTSVPAKSPGFGMLLAIITVGMVAVIRRSKK